MVTWDGRYNDYYVVDTADGTRTKIIEGLRGSASRSTGGKYVVWFDHRDYDWHCYDVQKGATRNLTADIPVAFDREQDDRPEPHRAHGVAGRRGPGRRPSDRGRHDGRLRVRAEPAVRLGAGGARTLQALAGHRGQIRALAAQRRRRARPRRAGGRAGGAGARRAAALQSHPE